MLKMIEDLDILSIKYCSCNFSPSFIFQSFSYIVKAPSDTYKLRTCWTTNRQRSLFCIHISSFVSRSFPYIIEELVASNYLKAWVRLLSSLINSFLSCTIKLNLLFSSLLKAGTTWVFLCASEAPHTSFTLVLISPAVIICLHLSLPLILIPLKWYLFLIQP